MKIMLQNVRLAFADLFVPRAFQGTGTPKFGVTAIFEEGSQAYKAAEKAIAEVAKEKYGDKWQSVVAKMSEDRRGLRDGNDKDADGFADHFYLTARNDKRPGVFDRDTTPLAAEDGRPYSGCYGNVEVDIWAQDNQFGKGINSTLLGVQFVRDGDAFGAGGVPSKADSFANLSAADEEEVSDPLA